MIKTQREQKICEKYGKRDKDGHVHCFECPLRKSKGDYDFRCKANSHYDRKLKDWVNDYNPPACSESKIRYYKVKQYR